MSNKDNSDLTQFAQTITNIIEDTDDDANETRQRKTREAYRHITLRGIVWLTLGSFIAGGLGACSMINISMERYHDLVLERDMLVHKNMRAVLDANQNTLDAMRDSLEKMVVPGMNYHIPEYYPPDVVKEAPPTKK